VASNFAIPVNTFILTPQIKLDFSVFHTLK
jgi:hypothetical protein